MCLSALFIALALHASPAPAADLQAPEKKAQGPRVLDRVVATIAKKPLLLSELEFEARVALIGRGGLGAATGALGDEALASVLDFVIGQRLAFAEAERLQVFAVTDEEVAGAVQAFIARFPSRARYAEFLQDQEASEEQLAAILRRDLRAARFIDSKVKVASRVTEADLRRFFDSHASDFAGQTFSQVRDGIRTVLTRDRYAKLAREALDELHAKADVRLIAPFAQDRAAVSEEPSRGPAPSGATDPTRP